MQMEFVAVQEITITGPVKVKGSPRVAYNYDLNGVPFGQVYSFKVALETHPWHAVKANGEHLGHFTSRKAADRAIRAAM